MPARDVPWTTEHEVAVVNPSPVPRTDVVRIPLDGFPLYRTTYRDADVHPLSLAAGMVAGMEADGRPVRVVRTDDPDRVRMIEDWPALDVELVVEDVPAFGWRTVRLTASDAHDDVVDDGRTIGDGHGLEVTVADDGTLTVTDGTRSFAGLAAVEDLGDRGDTYDFDPVATIPGPDTVAVDVERHRHPSGIRRLVVTRTLEVPARLDPGPRRPQRRHRHHHRPDGGPAGPGDRPGRPRPHRRRPGRGPPAPPPLPHGSRDRSVPGGHHVRRGRPDHRSPRRPGVVAPGAPHLPPSGMGGRQRPGGRRPRPARGRGVPRTAPSPSPCCGPWAG